MDRNIGAATKLRYLANSVQPSLLRNGKVGTKRQSIFIKMKPSEAALLRMHLLTCYCNSTLTNVRNRDSLNCGPQVSESNLDSRQTYAP